MTDLYQTLEKQANEATDLYERIEPVKPKPTLREKAADIVTGNLRQSRATQELPALADVGLKWLLGDKAGLLSGLKASAGLLTTFDPERQMQVIRSVVPDAQFTPDKHGNIIVYIDGRAAILNPPGADKMDAMQMGATAAILTPGAKAGAAFGTIPQKMAAVGGSEATAAYATDIANQALGGTESVSLANVDKGNVLAAGLGGGLFEGAAGLLARRFPSWRSPTEITNAMRQDAKRTIVQYARETGVDVNNITDQFVDDVINAARFSTGRRAGMPSAGASADEQRFGIQYTAGERSGNDALLEFEDSARYGAYGSRPREVISQFDTGEKAPSIARAVEDQSRALAPGQPVKTVADAGGVVRGAVQSAERQLDDQIGEAYAAVKDAALSVDGFKSTLRSVRTSVRDIEFDKTLPETAKVLDGVKSYERLLKTMGEKIRPIHIQRIEQLRRRFNTAINQAEGSDRMQVTRMKRAFDEALDGAMVNGLFEGDTGALSQLKEARGLRQLYGEWFEARPAVTRSGKKISDPVGALMEKIVAADPTDEQVANAIFGAGNVFGNQNGAKLVEKIALSVGKDSEAWQSIRQAAFMKLVRTNRDGTVSGRLTRDAIQDAVKKHPTLVKAIFSTEEVQTMRDLANAIIRAQPEIRNPSRTAYKASGLVGQTITRLATLIGLDNGTLSASANGAVAIRKTAQAKRSVRPFSQAHDVRPGLPAAGAATGVLASEEMRN